MKAGDCTGMQARRRKAIIISILKYHYGFEPFLNQKSHFEKPMTLENRGFQKSSNL